jgi:hypothetical protein
MNQTRCYPMAGFLAFLITGASLCDSPTALAATGRPEADASCGKPNDAPATAESDLEAATAAIVRLGGEMTRDDEEVTRIKLDGARLTDADLKHLKPFKSLRTLSLDRTAVTDAGLANLKDLSNLESLSLYETDITDAGLTHLSGLSRLSFVMLKRTFVTRAGAEVLERQLPDCLISFSPRHRRDANVLRLAGRWTAEFANGVRQTCVINQDGTASVSEPLRTSPGKAGVQGNAIVVAYDDFRVERWTLVGERVVVEHWFPAADSEWRTRWAGDPTLRPLPTVQPVVGIAERAR